MLAVAHARLARTRPVAVRAVGSGHALVARRPPGLSVIVRDSILADGTLGVLHKLADPTAIGAINRRIGLLQGTDQPDRPRTSIVVVGGCALRVLIWPTLEGRPAISLKSLEDKNWRVKPVVADLTFGATRSADIGAGFVATAFVIGYIMPNFTGTPTCPCERLFVNLLAATSLGYWAFIHCSALVLQSLMLTLAAGFWASCENSRSPT